jgi:hypothetical protein
MMFNRDAYYKFLYDGDAWYFFKNLHFTNHMMTFPIYFLAYFQFLKKYAIVRTLFVRRVTTFQGVDRFCSFMVQSIAYDPRA